MRKLEIKEIGDILQGVVPDYGGHFTDRLLMVSENSAALSQPETREVLSKLSDFCVDIANRKTELEKGYRVGFTTEFRHSQRSVFRGLYLTVFDSKGNTVGALRFRLGFPLEIATVQGMRGVAPREFFQKTGKHFDDVLLDTFISLA